MKKAHVAIFAVLIVLLLPPVAFAQDSGETVTVILPNGKTEKRAVINGKVDGLPNLTISGVETIDLRPRPPKPKAAAKPAPQPAVQLAAASATPPVAQPAVAAASAPAAIPAPAEPPETDLHAPFRQSLFFSPQDIIAIKKASETPKNVVIDPNTGNVQTPVIPMNRFIAVSGISYKGPDNWVVWINGRKVVKGGEGVLKELVEIKPQKDYVDMLWFDIGLNGTIKIRMRPNQTYYIVPGLLLPGVAQQ